MPATFDVTAETSSGGQSIIDTSGSPVERPGGWDSPSSVVGYSIFRFPEGDADQIRQNTKVARAATRRAISESTENLTSDQISNAEIAEIFVKHMNGEDLSPVENLRLQARYYKDMAHRENIHYQFAEGMVSTDEWLGFRTNLAALLAIDAYREYWEHESFHYSDAFRAEVASIYEEFNTDGAPADFASRFRPTSVR